MALLLVGCAEDAQEQSASSTPNFSVGMLFETEGCRVFRFQDAGHLHYFVRCRPRDSASTSATQTYTDGKNTHTEVEDIPTGTSR